MLKDFLRDQTGMMVAEYALLLAILCGGLACGAYFLADAISSAMAHTSDQLSAEWKGLFSNGTPP
jgi:Flp pilus assembly pilin Flp